MGPRLPVGARGWRRVAVNARKGGFDDNAKPRASPSVMKQMIASWSMERGQMFQGFEAIEWNRHERRRVVIGGIVLAHDGDEDLNLPRGGLYRLVPGGRLNSRGLPF